MQIDVIRIKTNCKVIYTNSFPKGDISRRKKKTKMYLSWIKAEDLISMLISELAIQQELSKLNHFDKSYSKIKTRNEFVYYQTTLLNV